MSVKENRFHFTRGKSTTRRSMLIACGAVCNATMLSFMASGAHAAGSFTWSSSSSGNWSAGGAGGNWSGGPAPAVDPNGDDSLEFSAPGTYTSNNDLGTFGIYNTTFDSGNGPTTLTGGDINLSWPLSEGNNPALANNSTNPVTINNNVTFIANTTQEGTGEYFVLAPGSTTTFNGSMNLEGGASLKMTNGQATNSTGGPGGTTIWTQPVTFTNSTDDGVSSQFDFRIFEGTFEMGGYTIDNGSSNAPIQNVDGVNIIQAASSSGAVNNGVITNMFIGPEDYESGHPNDVVAFYLIAGGESMNQPVQIGDAGSTTIGGVNTSGTVTFNDYFKTLPTDGNGIVNGVSQTIYFSAAAGGTVLQNFTMVRGGGSGDCGAGVDKIGPGTWIVNCGGDSGTSSGAQAYNGNTSIRDGTLELEYDDTGTNYVYLPAAVFSNPSTTYYANGYDGGSLGYNDPSNAVQLGDSGTLPTDNIALLTLNSPSAPGPRAVLHNISVNNDNPSGATTIGVGDNGTGNYSGNISLFKSVVLTGGAGGLANFSGNVTGTGAITVNGTGTVNLSGTNAYNGATNVTSGAALVIAVAGALPSGSAIVNNGSVTIDGNSVAGNVTGAGTLTIGNGVQADTLQLAINGHASSMNSLSILGNSTLDITNNKLFIDYGSGADPIMSIAAWIKNGAYNLPGPSIVSTAIAADDALSGLSYGIGYADGKDGEVAGLPSGEIEIMFTLLGDANLDGTVNSEDFTPFSTNLGKNGSWDQGDFNYDGTINSEDFTPFSHNLNQSASLASQAGVLEIANGISLTNVPEPASAGMMVLAGLGILRRRRRTLA